MHWNGFILPEHIEAMMQGKKGAMKLEKPVLDEQEKEEINAKLKMAQISYSRIEITYFRNGEKQKATGRIKELDTFWHLLLLRNEENTEVRIEDILDVFIL